MAASIIHRGPDGFGLYMADGCGMMSTRLAIVDLGGGWQPITNEDGTVVVVFNGEIYNHVELRPVLEARGHTFSTNCDTEVLVHLYEEHGDDLVTHLNGQFAFAIWDRRRRRLVAGRDRLGVRPLYYARGEDGLVFGSEVKALFASGEVAAAPDRTTLGEIASLWGVRAPRSPFEGVESLPPAHVLTFEKGKVTTRRYWTPPLLGDRSASDALPELEALLEDAVRIRLRADVPVGAYLSGGLDSSVTAALAQRHSPHRLRTFSVSFADPELDEAPFQEAVAKEIDSEHHVLHIQGPDLADALPQAVWHAEAPLVRTAPVPLMLLAQETRRAGITVVLTGEGADECFWGYDIFKETAVRAFCARAPESGVRPRLLDRLYPYQASSGGDMWRAFFLQAGKPDEPLFSHGPRMRLGARVADLFTAEQRAVLREDSALALEAAAAELPPVPRAAWVERETLLASYLLSAQGDRMACAHAVEGRFPFLDHRVWELAGSLRPSARLAGLREKAILRRAAASIVPAQAANRPKQPYRAPATSIFAGEGGGHPVLDALSHETVVGAGYFGADAVAGLKRRVLSGRAVSVRENMAFVFALTTQLWHDAFFRRLTLPAPRSTGDADVVLDQRGLEDADDDR